MRLGLVMLDNASVLNGLKYLNQVYISPGDTASVFFQIVDLDSVNQNNLIGNRYMPISGATMSMIIQSVNDRKTLVLTPTMAFPNDDRSIWTFSLTQYQTSIAAGVNLIATLTEGTKVTNILGKDVLYMNPPSSYSC